MTVNIGIIGFGGFGQFLYDSFKPLKHIKVTALADIKKNRDPGHTKFYTAWEDLIKDDNIDTVWIATVPNVHAEIACAAMYAGKDVIIEKPVATNIHDAKQILKVQKRTRKIAIVNYMMRYNPICICLAEYTHENIFGRLRRVNVENYAQDETLPLRHWFWNKKVSGGILIEHAVHFIDLVNYFSCQEYKKVHGISHKRKTGQEDQVFANVLYENGLIASHYHSFSRPSFFERTTIRLNYDLAEFDIEGWIPLKGCFRALANKEIRSAVKHLPNTEINKETSISTFLKSLDRPRKDSIRSGGIKYNVDKMIEGRFEIKEDKQHVYSVCVRALLTDFLARKKNPNHKMRVSLEDGISSLTIASLASKAAL